MKKYINKLTTAILLIGLAFIANSCDEDATVNLYQVKSPTISSVFPADGETGDEITITGENLGRIDTVKIGNGYALIKYRVSPEELIVKLTSTCTSGDIMVRNAAGNSTLSNSFTMNFPTPSVLNYPTVAYLNDVIILSGSSLNVIDSISIGDSISQITSQRVDEIVFDVPFETVKAGVAIKLFYNTESGTTYIGTSGETVVVGTK